MILNLPLQGSTNPNSLVEQTLQEMGFDPLMTTDERRAFFYLHSTAIDLIKFKEDPNFEIILDKTITELNPQEMANIIEFFNNRNY
jgi:hypothetical protein